VKKKGEGSRKVFIKLKSTKIIFMFLYADLRRRDKLMTQKNTGEKSW
jgi:hypothetical protein